MAIFFDLQTNQNWSFVSHFWIQSCYFGCFGGHEKLSYSRKNRFRKSWKMVNPKLGEIEINFTKNWILDFWNPKSVFAAIWRFFWPPQQPKLVICITFWIQRCYFGCFGGHKKSSYTRKNRFRKVWKVFSPKLREIKINFTKNWILGFWNPKFVFATNWRFLMGSKKTKIGYLYHILDTKLLF